MAMAAASSRRSPGVRGVGSGRMPKTQLSLPLPNSWGGARRGAGRKRVGRPKTAHGTRPAHAGAHPVHVTLRSEFRQLRQQFVFPSVRLAIVRAAHCAPESFRIIHWSVQYDHVHLIVEAESGQALSRGMQGLAVRIARYVNDLLGRRGRFWADRWHGRELSTPRAVRNALVYVLMNFRKHARGFIAAGVDALSSALHSDVWAHGAPLTLVTAHRSERAPPRVAAPSVAPARTWLATTGWRRHGVIRFEERPRSPA